MENNTPTNYNNSSILTNELGIAMDDFTYGSTVRLQMPALTPFTNSNNAVSDERSINTSNILNRDADKLQYTPCKTSNYIDVYIPEELYRYRNLCSKVLTYKGHKGEQFIVSFIGGDINKPVIVRRL